MKAKKEITGLLKKLRKIHKNFRNCIETNKQEKAAKLAREIYQLKEQMNPKEQRQVQKEINSAANYLSTLHRNNHFHLKKTSDQQAAIEQLNLFINYGSVATSIEELKAIIPVCASTEFVDEEKPNDRYYKLILLVNALNNKRLQYSKLSEEQCIALHAVLIREGELCFKRDDVLWMDFILAAEYLIDKPSGKIKQGKVKAEFIILCKQIDLIMGINKNTIVRAKRLIELTNYISQETQSNYKTEIANAYNLIGFQKFSSSDETRIGSFLPAFLNYWFALTANPDNVYALCQMILILNIIINRISEVNPSLLEKMVNLLTCFYHMINKNNDLSKEIYLEQRLEIYQIMGRQEYYLTEMEPTTESAALAVFKLLAEQLVSDYGHVYPKLFADVGKWREFDNTHEALAAIELQYPVISYYYQGSIEHCEKSYNYLTQFIRTYIQNEFTEQLISDLEKINALQVENATQESITQTILELTFHLGDYFDKVVMDSGLSPKSSLQLFLFDSMFKSYIESQSFSTDRVNALSLVIKCLVEEKNELINDKLRTYQMNFDDFQKKHSLTHPRIHVIALPPEPKKQEQAQPEVKIKQATATSTRSAKKSPAQPSAKSPEAATPTEVKSKRRRRKHKGGKYHPPEGQLTSSLGTQTSDKKTDVTISPAATADSVRVLPELQLLDSEETLHAPPTINGSSSVEGLVTNRLCSQLATESEVRGDTERETEVYTLVHEDSSTLPTKQLSDAVEVRKKSNTQNMDETLPPLVESEPEPFISDNSVKELSPIPTPKKEAGATQSLNINSRLFTPSSIVIIPPANQLPQPVTPASGALKIDLLASQILYHLGNAYLVDDYPRDLLTGVHPDMLHKIDIVAGIKPMPSCVKEIRLGSIIFRKHPQKPQLFQFQFLCDQDGALITKRYNLHISEALTISMEQDARTRNFTINTVYIRADGSYFLPISGASYDLQKRLLRLVRSDDLKSFEDDPRQILQYYYLTTTIYTGIYYPEQLKALHCHLTKIHPDQLFNDLNRFFMEGRATKCFEDLWEVELIQDLFPEICEEYGYELRQAMLSIDHQYNQFHTENLGSPPDYPSIYLPFVLAQLKSTIDYRDVILGNLGDKELFYTTVLNIVIKMGLPDRLAHRILGIESPNNPNPVNIYLDRLYDEFHHAYSIQTPINLPVPMGYPGAIGFFQAQQAQPEIQLNKDNYLPEKTKLPSPHSGYNN